MNQDLINTLVENLKDMADNDYHINDGMVREVVTNNWKKNGNDRTYLNIKCYTLAGRLKKEYKCGYVDNQKNEYVATKYDEVNAETKEYIGR